MRSRGDGMWNGGELLRVVRCGAAWLICELSERNCLHISHFDRVMDAFFERFTAEMACYHKFSKNVGQPVWVDFRHR